MKLGIKVAPGNAWKSDIESVRPSMIEIWYNAGRPDDYDAIFSYLTDKPIDVGLHYWGALPNNILTNIAYPDPAINEPSMALMKATIDVAANHHCVYVNVHPDLYSLLQVDFETQNIRIASEPADLTVAKDNFIKNFTTIRDYATAKSVLLTVETVPMRDTPSWNPNRDRTQVIDIHQMPMDVIVDLSARGVAIANDLCHTACNLITNDRAAIKRFLFDTTKTLASHTRLIHLGYVVPPYNGVDFHDSLDNPVFNTMDAIPNKSEMIELLKIFSNRDDVYILVEPKTDHIKNYNLARELLEKAGVLTKKG